ncbi:MAG TPA: hypothetical protein VFP50_06840 [Anaeromyxobacteraceae bacterium]|nr:hypothetical protein [Anaeromyxobacteraceae bacterium]
MPDQIELVHLRREVRTALELAIVALAPEDLVEGLAAGAGLLETIAELPLDAAPIAALAPRTLRRAREALDTWHRWQREHTPPPV